MQPAQLLALSYPPPLPNSQELGSRLNPMESCPIAPIVMFLGVCGGRSQDEGLCGDQHLTTGLRRLGNACAPAPKTMAENDTQAAIAQLAARRSHNPEVVSSILTRRILCWLLRWQAMREANQAFPAISASACEWALPCVLSMCTDNTDN